MELKTHAKNPNKHGERFAKGKLRSTPINGQFYNPRPFLNVNCEFHIYLQTEFKMRENFRSIFNFNYLFQLLLNLNREQQLF